MYLAPMMMLLGAMLLSLASYWYACDGRKLEAPYAPAAAHDDVQAWADDLDASLVIETPIAAHVIALDTDRPLAPVYMRLGMVRPIRHGAYVVVPLAT